MENIEKVIFGGVEYPMVEGVELETYLDAIGVPENATKDFDPVTNALHINVPSGTKGNDLEEDSEDWTEDDIKKINKALKIYNIYYQNTYSKKGTKHGFINLYDYLPYKEKMSVFEEFKVAKIVYSYSAQRIYQENKL